jgi:CubicO group peptidase (beta-lactamase class C family)
MRMTTLTRIRVLLSVFLLTFLFTNEVRPQNGHEALVTAIDNLMNSQFKPQEPGASVIVVKDGKVLFRKGYGLANMELGVGVEPDMIFRIGSITKQFTAAAILMLEEQGKLSVKDDITKYLPDYPTQGKKITVEHLLTHTSGIKSYTSLPEWLPQWRKDFKVDELIALFKDKPMDFVPGEGWNYNNSAYFLLGPWILCRAKGGTTTTRPIFCSAPSSKKPPGNLMRTLLKRTSLRRLA